MVASLVAQRLKRLPTMQETWVRSLGWEDHLEKEMVTHSSILAWRILWTEKPGRLPSRVSQRVGHDWATSLSLEHSSALPFFRIGMKTDLFQSCGHCWLSRICWCVECFWVQIRESVCKSVKVLVAQSCPTLCDPIDYSPPDSLSMGFAKQEYWSE